MQYPPGTGFVLALFPQGFQVIPLYVLATVIVFGFALLGISYARSRLSVLSPPVWLPRDLPDDQSGQGELFGGAHDGGVRACGLSHRETVFREATASSGFGRARRPPRRSVGQFQIAEPVSRFRIFCCSSSFHSCRPEKSKPSCMAPCSPSHSWSAWRRRCLRTRSTPAVRFRRPMAPSMSRPRVQLRHHPELPRRHAIRVARARGARGPIVMLRLPRGNGARQVALVTAGNLAGEYGLLHDPPRRSRLIIRSRSRCFRCGACCLPP